VDFKSIPYKDTEIIQWRNRLEQAWQLQEQLHKGHAADVLPDLRRLGITHVIVSATVSLRIKQLQLLYEDPFYRLYRIAPSPQSSSATSRRKPGREGGKVRLARLCGQEHRRKDFFPNKRGC
jgi:hypothetical protein